MKKLIILFLAAMCVAAANAVPAYPGWQTKINADGSTIEVRCIGDETVHYYINRDGDEVRFTEDGNWETITDAPARARVRALQQKSPRIARIGSKTNLAPRGLVILASYQDTQFKPSNGHADMDSMLNGANYTYRGAHASVREYFREQSNGLYVPQFDVVGPITVSQKASYYGANNTYGNDKNPEKLIVEACQIAHDDYGVDFTRYDNDSDGQIDFVYVFYAGKGEADGGAANTIWPHNWYVYDGAGVTCMLDGKLLNNYACSSELDGRSGQRNGMGTFCHEFSHVLGLPDYYNTGNSYYSSSTPGAWSLMDAGSYNNDGNTPPNYSIYDKFFLGWIPPEVLDTIARRIVIEPNSIPGASGFQLSSANELQDRTAPAWVYYLENRQQTGWDTYLPGHGMLIWKVKYSESAWSTNSVNNGNTPYCSVVRQNSSSWYTDESKTTFPGTSFCTMYAPVMGKSLLNITESAAGVISLDFIDVVSDSLVTVTFMALNDTVSTKSVLIGADLVLPAVAELPACIDKNFIGWTADPNYADPIARPRDLFSAPVGKAVSGEMTYFAVYE